MLSSTILASILALAPLAVFASPTPAVETATWEGVHLSTPATIAERELSAITKRDSCGTNGLFDKGNGRSMQSDLQNNNPNDSIYLPAGAWTSWTLGNARVCVYNDYLYENTHTTRWESGWGVGTIMDSCCGGGNSQCQGGGTTTHGDSGLNLRTTLKNSAYDC